MTRLLSSVRVTHFASHSQLPDVPVALKEWAVAEKALREGRQNLILRKGGIREETKHFQLEGTSFFLYPTYEHQKQHLLREEFHDDLAQTLDGWDQGHVHVMLRSFAQVTEEIEIMESEVLQELSPYHIWTPDFVEERLRWKKYHPLHVLLIRVFVLDKPIQLLIRPEYLGCKSWVGLKEKLGSTSYQPVLPEAEFQERRKKILEVFAGQTE